MFDNFWNSSTSGLCHWQTVSCHVAKEIQVPFHKGCQYFLKVQTHNPFLCCTYIKGFSGMYCRPMTLYNPSWFWPFVYVKQLLVVTDVFLSHDELQRRVLSCYFQRKLTDECSCIHLYDGQLLLRKMLLSQLLSPDSCCKSQELPLHLHDLLFSQDFPQTFLLRRYANSSFFFYNNRCLGWNALQQVQTLKD